MPIAFPPTVYSRVPLMSGDAGVAQTINQMRQLVDEALRDPSIIRLATDIVRPVAAFDDIAEANALYEWVKRNIRFTKDPINKEKLYPPSELLKIRAGDCDDISMLLGTLLMAVGYPARLMTVAAGGDEFSHVYVEANIHGQWIPLDPARYDSQFGIAPPAFTRARWWSLSDNSQGDLSGFKMHVHPGATATVNLGDYPRFRSLVSGLGDLGTAPDPNQVNELIVNGYNATTINQVIAIGATNEQLQALPYPASAAEMQAGINALVAELTGVTAPATVSAPKPSGATTSSLIATIANDAASAIKSFTGPYASYQTEYSPYGINAGYPSAAPVAAGSLTMTPMSWALLGVGAILLFKMVGR